MEFVLGAETLDGGEQVTSLTLPTARLGPFDPASLTTGTFGVHAKATSPVGTGGQDIGHDLDRPVTAARLDDHGDIVLELGHGAGTLGYADDRGRNFRLDLAYTVTQNAPLRRRGRPVPATPFTQGPLVNPEVDAFGHHMSRSGMKYRLYSPAAGSGRRPLIVWLHGAGEGASLPDGYYDNETTLRANRGALGFATEEAQAIFDGAYVVAPQCTSVWMDDGPGFAPLIHEIIRDVRRTHPVDPDRVLVAGCSNGGYMSLKMTTVYPDAFAASVPICGVVAGRADGDPPLIPDAELAAIGTPTWLVASLDDDTVDTRVNTVHAHERIPGSKMTLYDEVVRHGHRFPGHASWIYVARNDPSAGGVHIWQWMAANRR
ncbi:prolyl oligopeptidase family serine peptidase [Amycolatopsis sp. OK19-0408]|uniref:Prolyl oligopeptidase family serine peptidase n=1 Tax=Amycolatopsis iheyensis TaxID=2945988 RepID=A0A9X2SMP3_9PSEU|nr:PHB depolymerase family esterase [Amycolatopsis iheyensis]MCR6487373.1 prolyl oligopeptidase family serine peptidase [Amycolatopsis iheyensis]